MSGPKPIVVGVDGSDAADRALDWALDEALLRGCGVRAVHAWVFEPLGDTAPAALRETADWAAVKLAKAVTAVVGRRGDTPPIEQISVEGGPAEVLINHSRDAALLVVARHSGERLRKAILGSVSDACVKRAAIPVVVLPAGVSVPSR